MANLRRALDSLATHSLQIFFAAGPALLSCFVAFGIWIILDSRQQAWDRAALSLSNVTALIEHNLARNIDILDLYVQSAIRSFGIPGIGQFEPDVRQTLLFDGSTRVSHVGSIFIVGAAGEYIYESLGVTPRQISVSQRDYFTVHRDQPDAGLYISNPFLLQNNGSWAIVLSRRLPSRSGSFSGIAAGSLTLDYFDKLVSDLHLTSQDMLTLLRTDGTLIARAPSDGSPPGTSFPQTAVLQRFNNAPNGVFEATSAIDGVQWLFAYRQVGNYPLVVSTAIAMHDVYANWRTKAIEWGVTVLALAVGTVGLFVLHRRELDRRRKAEEAARESEAQYHALVDYSSDTILRTGLDGVQRYVSPSIERLIGYRPEELEGEHWNDFIVPDDLPLLNQALAQLVAGAPEAGVTVRVVHSNGSVVWVEGRSRLLRYPATGRADQIVTAIRNVTAQKLAQDALEAVKAELEHLAVTDGLTGLANRRQFDEALAGEWRRARRELQPLSLLMLDVDYFKLYNDRYGHQRGDQVLRTIAVAIQAHTRRPGDVGARYGGEEFAVILPNTSPQGAMKVAEAIRKAVAELRIPHEHGSTGFVTVSIGAASGGETSEAPSALVEDADQALYCAKGSGRNRIALAESSKVIEAA